MKGLKRERALLHARTSRFLSAVVAARHNVDQALRACATWYIALSGGKDSTVVLDLVRSACAEVPATHSQRQWELPETAAYLSRVGNVRRVSYFGLDGTDWARSWDSKESAEQAGVVWLDDANAIACRGAVEDGVFLGLRADENGYRRVHLRTLGPLHNLKGTKKWHANPIAFWSVWDVWAYIYSRGIDYNLAYDRLDDLGIEPERQRIGPLAVERALGYGQIAILKRGWPELWNRYAAEHPEARQYA
jgi:3'-phosphoadenosine 5'-phosphosulfate sulfotransferase (PAPS reductase)/FAD synthetase